MGKKRSKAHLAAQKSSKSGLQPSNNAKHLTSTKKEESEDEDEGRTAIFKSKRQTVVPSLSIRTADSLDEHTSSSDGTLNTDGDASKVSERDPDDDRELNPLEKKIRSGKKKPVSYLDEILAERSKKKRK